LIHPGALNFGKNCFYWNIFYPLNVLGGMIEPINHTFNPMFRFTKPRVANILQNAPYFGPGASDKRNVFDIDRQSA
jgi:hypothetical protein